MCVRMSLCKLEWRSARLCILGVVSFLVPRICGHVLSPLMGGSASANVMSGVVCPSTTPRAAAPASSLCVTPVCDLILPICVLYPRLSLVRMMSSASCRSSLWGWWLKQRVRIDSVVAYGVDDGGAICEYREGVFVLVSL